MRVHPSVPLIAALGLVACGKPATQSDQSASSANTPASSEAAAPAATPAGPTDAQKKAMLATLPAAYQAADLENGQAKFALCQSCHTVVQGGPAMTGPNLWGIFGRKAGSSPDFSYSDGMKAYGIVWDADHLEKWITNPRAVIAGTKMTYLGMENPKDRIDTIAYLKTVTTAPGT